MKTIDVTGMRCPMPLIETKKALKASSKDEVLKIIIDNETSVKNVNRYLQDNEIFVDQRKIGNNYELIIKNKSMEIKVEETETNNEPTHNNNEQFVVVFGKDRLGEGSDELGNVLVGGMLTTFLEMKMVPSKIIFMNSGINLVVEGSPVLQVLESLEAKETDLISCGTCLDYFGKTNQLAVGRVTNMLEIMEILTSVSKVVNI